MSIKALVTDQLILKKLDIADAPFRFELFKDAEEAHVFGAEPFKDLSEAKRLVKGFVNLNALGFQYHWTLFRKEDGRRVGFLDAYHPAPHLMAMKLCEISFGLETGERGLGYMREALSSGLDFLIRQEGVHRIEANVSVENHRSAKLLEGVGFEKEGLRKKLWRWGDTWHDMMLYALTQEDWSGHLTENH